MQLGTRHWLIALVSAVAVHLSLLTLFERPEGPVAPAQGILIQLGAGGDVGGGASGPEGPSPLGAEDLPEAEPVVLQTMESEAAAEVQAEESDLTEPEPPMDPVALAEPVPVPEPVIAEPPAPAKPKTATRSKTKPKKQKKTRSAKRKKKASKARRDKKPARAAAREAARGGGEGEAGKGSGKQGAGAGSGASPAAAQSRYAGQISAWLNRNKRYPKRARRLEQQGSVTVRFTVDRNGRVLSSNIVRSSGHAALDDEVRALMRRGRMPRMPAIMKQSRMTMTAPIRFRLQ